MEALRTLRPCVIDSMFQVPWPPVCVLPTQHKVDFQHSTFLLLTYCRCLFEVCVENFQNLESSMSYAFSIAMHCVCLQAGRPKWVHVQDPKHRINYARPNAVHKKEWLHTMVISPLPMRSVRSLYKACLSLCVVSNVPRFTMTPTAERICSRT
jgi:hypothetical protein